MPEQRFSSIVHAGLVPVCLLLLGVPVVARPLGV
jgi:hypothetical protein